MGRGALIKEVFREGDQGGSWWQGRDEMQWELFPSPGGTFPGEQKISAPLLCLNVGKTAACLPAGTMGCSPASHIHLDPLL